MQKPLSFKIKAIIISCTLALNLTAFAQTDFADNWEQEREKAALLFIAADEQQRYSDQLNIADLNFLPINLSRTISNVNYAIAIIDYEMEENYISATAYARVILPQGSDGGKEKVLFFATKDLHLSYDGNIIGGATLALIGNMEISLMGGRAKLVLKGNFDMNSGQTTTATFLTMDCKGFKELSIDADLVFPESFIKKAECSANCQVAASFKTVVSDWNDILLKVDLPKFEIAGLSDFIFEVKDAVFDMSDKRNEQMSFPSDYASQFLTSGCHELWKGVYIKKLNVTLPPQFEEKGSDKRISFDAEDFLIDNNGCSALFSANNLLPIDKGSASGWRFAVDQFKLELQANQLVAGGFGGRIGLPISDTATLQYTAFITQDNQYSLTVTPPKNLSFDVFSAQVELSKNSLISLSVENKKFVPEAKLSGTMSIAAKTMPTDAENVANFKGVKFQDLHLQTREPFVSIGALGYEGELKLMNFPVSVNKIEMRTVGNDLSLFFGINLDLGAKGVDIGSSTTLEIVSSMKDSEGQKHWAYKETKISNIEVQADIADICKIKGNLDIRQNDPVYGNGFQGQIGLSFGKMLEGLSVDVRAIFGRTDFNYWLVDGLVGLPGQGIPIFTGINLKGFGGGASFKMTADGEDIGMPTKAKYVPSEENGLGLKAAVLLGLSSGGNALNIEASFEVGFNNNGGLLYAGLFGQATFMGNIPGADNVADFVGDKFNSVAELEKQFVGNDPAQKDILQKMKLYDPNKSAATTYKPSQTPGQSGLIATMSMKFDFANNSFHGNFDVYANMAGGIIKGSGDGNSAGKAVMHIEPGKWYLHIGNPTNRVGLEMNLAGLINANVGAYFMMGDEMPDPPNPPDEVVSILSESGAQVKDNRNLQGLKAGRGFAFGTDFSVSTGDINAWIVYANFSAGVGFDMMLIDYGEAQCAGRTGPIGMDGWYATGQAYAYLQGEVGVNVNLLAVKKKITILKGGAAALLQAQLPNPFWMAGTLGMKFEVLNGLVKGSVNLQIELGEQCEIIRENPSPLGVDVISDLTPHTGTNDVDVFSAPQAAFNMAINTAFEIDDNGTSRWYRLKLEEFNVYDKGTPIQGTVKWSNENTIASFEAHEILPPETNLSAKVKVVFEQYKDGYWSILQENGKIAEEEKTVDFVTGGAPDYIPLNNIAYCYPVVDQHFFHVNEDQNGYIKLIRGQSYLLADNGLSYEILFTTNSGQTSKVPFIYETSNNKIAFSTAQLKTGQNYRLQLVSFSANAGTVGQDMERRKEVAQEEMGNVSIKDAKAGLVTREDVGNTLLAYDFGTSRYETFAEKINGLNKKRQARWPTSFETHFLQYTLLEAEGFDEVELVGNVYTSNKPLIDMKAALDDDYFVKTIAPLLYNNYPIRGEIHITSRDVSIYGVPPAKALPIDDDYLAEVRNGDFSHLAIIFFPYYYNVEKIYNDDFYNLRGQAVNRYIDDPGNLGTLMGSYFPMMDYGNYNANMQYTLPGGKNGSKAVFTYLHTATN